MSNTKDELTLLDLGSEGDGRGVLVSDLLGGLASCQLFAHFRPEASHPELTILDVVDGQRLKRLWRR